MKLLIAFILFTAIGFSQEIVKVSGKSELIADFHSTGEAPNVKGLYLDKYQTLVSKIDGTNTVKCMVRIGSTVNVIGEWELNDLNDVDLKVYEVSLDGKTTDVLMIALTDKKAIQMNLFRLHGEDLEDLGYNYIEQKNVGEEFTITIGENTIKVVYDRGTETPLYGIKDGAFVELVNE
ncbi:MAG: hypothetical protein IT221_02945 [Fluviicola sp.]|nr:hypothetical protein [Fluviicola sp.]